MDQNDILETLQRLEEFRVKIENGDMQAGCPDWIIRVCQAKVAQDHFSSRVEWSEMLKDRVLNNI